MDIRTYLSSQLADAIATHFPEARLAPAGIMIEKPRNRDFGDFSSAVAMNLAKRLKRNPAEIARTMMDSISWDTSYVQTPGKSAVVGGFMNWRVSHSYLFGVLKTAVAENEIFGRNQVQEPKRMLLEFVSANPTGPMVVVNARAAAVGDVYARVNDWVGNTVDREYYVNDSGNQIDLLGKSVACRYLQKKGVECEIPEGGYEGEYISELAEQIASKHPELDSLEREQMEQVFRTEALEHNIAHQQQVLSSYKVTYTKWFRESDLHSSGRVEQVAEGLRKAGCTYKKDGAEWFRATDYGDEKDWVIYRSDGTPTYFLADAAYHADKDARGYQESHTFWGPDHHGYLPHLECVIKALDLRTTSFSNYIIQQVNLIRDGQPFRMSKRRGDFITMTDLVDEVGVDAARYFFLMRRLSSHFDFDMGLAVKKSDDNPVFYVQYAHARQCSLIRHAESQDFSQQDILSADPALLVEEEELGLLKLIAEFPTVVLQTAVSIEPHRLTTYAESMASAFHQFYQKHRVVTEDRALSASRLLLVTGVKNTIHLVLSILGVSAPESM